MSSSFLEVEKRPDRLGAQVGLWAHTVRRDLVLRDSVVQGCDSPPSPPLVLLSLSLSRWCKTISAGWPLPWVHTGV